MNAEDFKNLVNFIQDTARDNEAEDTALALMLQFAIEKGINLSEREELNTPGSETEEEYERTLEEWEEEDVDNSWHCGDPCCGFCNDKDDLWG